MGDDNCRRNRPRMWEFRLPEKEPTIFPDPDADPLDNPTTYMTTKVRFSKHHGEVLIERIRDKLHEAQSDAIEIQGILLPVMDYARLRAYIEHSSGDGSDMSDHFEGVPIHAVHDLQSEIELVYNNSRKLGEHKGAYDE